MAEQEEFEFDEESYKEENGYDDLYDKYLLDVRWAVQSDPLVIEGDYKGSNCWMVTDDRDFNDYPMIYMTKLLEEEYKIEENQAEIRRVETAIQENYRLMHDNANFKNLAQFYEFMQIAKKEAEQAYKDEHGNKADANKGNQPDNANTDKDASANIDPSTLAAMKKEQEAKEAFEKNIKKMYEAWDPRLQRLDYFFMHKDKKDEVQQMVRIPFSSFTAATAFQDQAWALEAGAAIEMFKNIKDKDMASQNIGLYKLMMDASTRNQIFGHLDAGQKVITQNQDLFTTNDKNWGVQSIVNPYSLTKLVGGIGNAGNEGNMNYMYDIRDRRRFYGLNMITDDVLAIDNPTITQLIEYGNQDAWGRTPYSFQDFVYCKYFGIIPNNRLITLRRYAVPTYDNLQFENMFGDHETTTVDNDGNRTYNPKGSNINAEQNTANKIFSPHASVVTWFGGDTGNTLSGLMNFTTGIPWEDLKSQIYNVTGNEGESKQSVIDKLLGDSAQHLDLFGRAEHEGITSIMQSGSWVSAKIASFGKFALGMNGKIGMDQTAYDKLAVANRDPYDQTFRNRIKGPVNRIDSVKKRKEGIEFSQTLTIKCHYMTKAIGGINPKAAILDVMGNCLEMVSPHAVFWGGGHHFQISPQMYPFHDKGWRDSFMAKIYDGKLLGNDGAVNTVLKGLKLVGEDGSGNFNMDTLKSTLGQMGGEALSLVGSAINGMASIFGGGGLLGNLGDMLNSKGADLQGVDEETAKKSASGKISNMFNNLKQLWSNKMIATTTQPTINGMGGLLIGEPTGEWHLTVGNPLNPIMVIGNLVCKSAKFTWNEELGPDDFPTGFEVEYTLEHSMARDSDAIQSMFNRGMGKFYTLPDYMTLSSERTTEVDEYTGDGSGGDSGTVKWMSSGQLLKEANKYGGGNQTYRISAGQAAKNAGNYDTRLLTKFTPLNDLPSNTLSVNAIRHGTENTGTTAIIRSRAATRKMMGNS